MTSNIPAWDWNRLLDTSGPLADETRGPKLNLGKYRLVREIARGAMGVVYEAEDGELRRPVAIKVLREIADARDETRERFQREALAAARLDHPNVVRVYDSGEDQGRAYLVMELVRGQPLSETLGGRKFELRPMLVLLEKAARGVAAAHDAGIVHRDVKPANILVTESGEPKVGDFGLAHWMDSTSKLTRTGTPVGTPIYMAPEQIHGGGTGVSPATDVYALGVILYELLTGRPPHTGDSTVEIYGKIVGHEAIAPKRLNSGVSRELETICLHALEKEAARRYPTAREFAEDLKRHLQGEAILARPPGALESVWKWVRRHRTVSTGVAVALAGAVALAAVLAAGAARRRVEVVQWLREGERALDDYRSVLLDLERDRAREREMRERIDASAGPDLKTPLWDLQKRIEEAELRSHGLSSTAAVALQSALKLDPDNVEAKRRLAHYHLEKLRRAESERLDVEAEEHLQWIKFYGRELLPPDTSLEGTLRIDSRPGGAEVELWRYKEGRDRRLVAETVRFLGSCPVPRTPLPAGSYLLILRKPGFRDVRHPVRIGTTTGHEAVVNLYRDADIGEGFVYVPGGPFPMGGDSRASLPAERATVQVPDFFISTFEVTIGEYVEFVDDHLRHGHAAEAQQFIPRTDKDLPLWTIPEGATRTPIPPTINLSHPIFWVTWHQAAAYARWRTARSRGREVCRLPTGAEWEKAARGADGRGFPWGNHFDWSFTNGGRSGGERSAIAEVGKFEGDESPYGVRDMAGNLSEWCADSFDGKPDSSMVVRGSSWGTPSPERFRSASISYWLPQRTFYYIGFRIVKETPRREH